MPTCKLMKKSLLLILHVFCLHFLRIHYEGFFQRGFKSVRAQFLSILLVIYCSITIHLSQLSSCLILHLTFFWVQFLSNQLELFLSCDIKIKRTSISCSVFWCVLFYENLIVLHHGDNNFLFYFEICIKFILSIITLTMKKW